MDSTSVGFLKSYRLNQNPVGKNGKCFMHEESILILIINV